MKYDGHLLLTAHPCANYAQPHSVCPTPVPPLGRATFPVELRCLRPAVSKHSLPGECSRHSDDEGWWRNLDRIKKLLFSSKTYKIGYAPRLPILFNGYLKLLSYPKNLNGRVSLYCSTGTWSFLPKKSKRPGLPILFNGYLKLLTQRI